MTAIQGGEQRPSDSPPTPLTGGSATTQTPLTGGLLLTAALSATRRPLLVSHKAIGGATTQTRTTNILPTPPGPPIQRRKSGEINLYSSSAGPWTSFTPNSDGGLQTEMGHMREMKRPLEAEKLVRERGVFLCCFQLCFIDVYF